LKRKAVCKAAPIPGETKNWQYVTLTKRIYLIDCPGVVNDATGHDTDTDKVLKSVIRAEKLQEPVEYIQGILDKAKKEYLQKLYRVQEWTDYEDFVSQVAINFGKLKKVDFILF
jgi:nuclear GTP-binding protein